MRQRNRHCQLMLALHWLKLTFLAFFIGMPLADALLVRTARAQPPSVQVQAPAASPAPSSPGTKATGSKAKSKATATPAAAPAPASGGAATLNSKEDLAGQGPLQFRCDKMQIFTKPNRTLCVGNVVFRRGPVLACCRTFEGTADENWDLQKATCTEDVRAQRGDETIWSERAEYTPASGDLLFTGRPVVQRGASIIEGERIVANVNEERARVEKPRGQLVSEPPAAVVVPLVTETPTTPLPVTCPLPARKR